MFYRNSNANEWGYLREADVSTKNSCIRLIKTNWTP